MNVSELAYTMWSVAIRPLAVLGDEDIGGGGGGGGGEGSREGDVQYARASPCKLCTAARL